MVAISRSSWYPCLFLPQRSCASFNRLEWHKCFFSLCSCPCTNAPVAVGVGARSKRVPVPLCRAAGEKKKRKGGKKKGKEKKRRKGEKKRKGKKKKKAAPCWPEMVSVLSRLIQFAFGSGWERRCWRSLERHICSLATGSKEANQMEGLRRASPGSQVSTPDCFQQTSPPAPRKAFQRQKPPPAPPPRCQSPLPLPSPAAAKHCHAVRYLHSGGLSFMSRDYWVLRFLSSC